MAGTDLTNIQAAEAVKIIGNSSTGLETNPVNAHPNGDLQTSDLIDDNQGIQGALTVGTSAVEVKVGSSRLATRKQVSIFNNSNSTIYWGFTSGVTTANGTPIFKNQPVYWSIGGNQAIYVIAGGAGNDTRVTEA